MLKDLEQVEKRRERALKDTKAAGKQGEAAKHEDAVLDKVKAALEAGTPLRAQKLSDEERAVLKGLFLLTAKPVLYIANVDESQLGKEGSEPAILAVKAIADADPPPLVEISGK